MTNEVIKQIWNLPWYSVMKIAFIDDLILFVKLWPLWCFLIIGVIVWIFLDTLVYKYNNEK